MNIEDIKKKRNEIAADLESSGSGDIIWYSPESGDNVIRILPPISDDMTFYVEAWVHWVDTEEGRRKFTCLKQDQKKDPDSVCPICQMVKELYESKNRDDIRLANSMRAKVQYIMNIVDRSDGQIKVYNAPQTVFFDILGIFSYPEYFKTLVDPEEGVDIVINKRVNPKNKRNVKYSVMPVGKKTPIGIKDWKEKCVDLNILVKRYSYEELAAILSGASLEEEPNEEINEIEKAEPADEAEETEPKAEIEKAEEKSKIETDATEVETKPRCFGTFDDSDGACQACPVKDKCKFESQSEKSVEKTETASPKDIKERIMRKLRNAQKKT